MKLLLLPRQLQLMMVLVVCVVCLHLSKEGIGSRICRGWKARTQRQKSLVVLPLRMTDLFGMLQVRLKVRCKIALVGLGQRMIRLRRVVSVRCIVGDRFRGPTPVSKLS